MALATDSQRRELHHGMKGPDVLACGRLVARTLKHMGQVSVNAQNGTFGDGLLRDVLRLQKLSAIPADGIVGPTTWHALDPAMHAWERLLLALPKPKPASNGTKLAAQMRAMLILGLSLYTQRRPAAGTIKVWRAWGSDCSGSALLARCLVLSRTFDGYGNTQFIWDNFAPVLERDVQLGDFLLYGRNGQTEHVAVISDVENELAIGFGAAPGRESGWRSYRTDVMGFRRGV